MQDPLLPDPPVASVVKPVRTPKADRPLELSLAQARAFALPLLAPQVLSSGENTLSHADGMAHILREIGADESLQACPYLAYASEHLQRSHETLSRAFSAEHAQLANSVMQLNRLQRLSLASANAYGSASTRSRSENIRRMVLAFSKNLSVVLVRLASRLQTLRHHAQSRSEPSRAMVHETLQVFAPLANRLGIWQVKWEIEDLAFRFLEPHTYYQVAQWLDAKRSERELYIQALVQQMKEALAQQGITADIMGRPKHIYSIVNKMRSKGHPFEQIFDIRALRVVVQTLPQCYTVLSWVHEHFQPVVEEFTDYIARPKENGYQSLHSVVRDPQGRAIEVQIRTQTMHQQAEHGVAAHWVYKEAHGAVSAQAAYNAKIEILRQLLAWQSDVNRSDAGHPQGPQNIDMPQIEEDDRIYALTPEAAIVDLPAGSTPIDFAYSVHTDLGHRCRGARVNGAMVPLSTPLQNGQIVSIVAAKEGGPSRDWLNPDLGFLASPRARNKVRAWINAQATQETITRGRDIIERVLQRNGKTALKLEELAAQLGFKSANACFEAVGKNELSPRTIETMLRPAAPALQTDQWARKRISSRPPAHSQPGVLVEGMESLLIQLARCCKPVPPDLISGFVTRGKGVSIHRQGCPSLTQLLLRESHRIVAVRWSQQPSNSEPLYPVDVQVLALDRPMLLRDLSEIFAREKLPISKVQSQVTQGQTLMTFSLKTPDMERLSKVMQSMTEVKDVFSIRRR